MPRPDLPFTVEELDRRPNYPAQAEVTVSELRDGRYSTVAVTTAPLTAERPFPITITPAT